MYSVDIENTIILLIIIISIVIKSLKKVGSGRESTSIRSALAKLTVLVPPGQPKIVHQGFEDKEGRTELELEVEEGEELELTCISEGGRPAGEITWRDEEGEQVRRDSLEIYGHFFFRVSFWD